MRRRRGLRSVARRQQQRRRAAEEILRLRGGVPAVGEPPRAGEGRFVDEAERLGEGERGGLGGGGVAGVGGGVVGGERAGESEVLAILGVPKKEDFLKVL